MLWMLLFSHPVVSNSVLLHGLQHGKPPCPSSSPEGCPSSRPLHQWCHPAISSFDALFSSCPQSFSESGTFPWVSCWHQMTKILGLQLQHQSFQRVFRLYYFNQKHTELWAIFCVSISLWFKKSVGAYCAWTFQKGEGGTNWEEHWHIYAICRTGS